MATEALKLIIDCDAGIDDAQGIIIALSHGVEVLGITCTFGNVDVDRVSKNVLRILEVCDRTDVPVYKGCNRPILGSVFDKPAYHGNDGLGDAPNLKEPDMSLLKPAHAVQALVQLVSENPGQVVIVALGPLTNIALACHMDPSFPQKVKSIFLMGGSIYGKGNHWVSAEFNFGADPEAAYIVLNEFKSPISVISWDACLDHPLDWDFYFQYVGQGTKLAEFLKIISSKIKELEGDGPFITCDPFAICAAINPQIVLQEKLVHASVELHGHLTRGQMVVDWRCVLRKECNVRVLEKLNLDLFKKMMLQSVK